DGPETHAVRGETVVLQVGAIGRVAPVRPDEAHRRPVDREGDRASWEPDRNQSGGTGLVGALVEARVSGPPFGEDALETLHISALGKPETPRPPQTALL